MVGHNALVKGVLVNVLSPHPYLFWISVGAPLVHRAMAVSVLAAGAFIAGFYLFLVGSKIALALVVAPVQDCHQGPGLWGDHAGLGGVLCLLAVMLVKDGLRLLEVF